MIGFGANAYGAGPVSSIAKFCGLELARHLEQVEIAVSEECLDVSVRQRPESGATMAHIAGGRALFFGAVSPLTQALGVGMAGPVSAEDFNRLESFFRARSAPVVLSLSPFADESVFAHLHERRYRIHHFENTLIRPLNGDSAPSGPVHAKLVTAADRDEWARVVTTGFGEGQPPTADLIQLVSLFFDSQSASAWAALDQSGDMGGGATLSIFGQSAIFHGDSTMPSHRRQGMQSALIEARIQHAAAAGCTLAIACTVPGTVSQRNYERAGFRVAYTKLMAVSDFT
jgi:GNAT superfamily N-acetyltransferase